MNFKTVKAWKVEFIKNNTSDGGAMREALNHLKPDEVPIHSFTNKQGRMWGNTSPKNLLKMIEKNKGLYEVIHSFPHKVYFDIDKKGKDENHLNKVKSLILSHFPNADMAISGSITDEKTSYHIALQNYIIHNEDERQTIKHIAKYISEKEDESFDWKVYTQNRNMKLINQSKPNKPVQEIIENDDFKAHCITCFINDYSLPIPINEKIEVEIQIEKSKKTFDLGTLPKMILKTPKQIDNIYNCSPKDILELLPISDKFEHGYTHLVARFCYHNKIEFEVFHSWYKNKSDKVEDQKKWLNHWSKMDKFPSVDMNKMINILNHYYPDIKKEQSFRLFANTFKFPTDKVKKIETISQTCFNDPSKYLLFNVGMGGGKTYQTIEYLKSQNNYLWIAPNIALSNNTKQRFEDNNMSVKHYLEFNKKKKDSGKMNDEKRLIVVLNSLHYLTKKMNEVEQYYNVVVIDEIETLLDKFLGDFMEQGKLKLKKQIWETFCTIIKNADKVVFLDAFITTKTINFINKLESENTMTIFERINEPQTRTIKYMKDYDTTLNDIVSKIKDGNKVIIFYPYKNGCKNYQSMEAVYSVIKQLTGKDGIYYNADVDDKIKNGLRDVNKSWEDKTFIITNNIITCGVNYENIDVDYKYIMVASHNTPRDIIQFSYRARHLNTGIIKICYLGKMNQTNTWINDCENIQCPIYSKLYSDILIEKKAPIKKSIQLFCYHAHYKQETENSNGIDVMLTKQIKDLFDNLQLGFTYNTIKDIDNKYADEIQQAICGQEATMYQKFQLRKFYFKSKFNDSTDDKLSVIWDEGYDFFFSKLANVLVDENNIFNKIKKINEMTTIFPVDVKKTKLDDDILTDIFKKFSFKYINKTSSHKLILKEIYNTYFNKFIITTKPDEKKHLEYMVNEDVFEYYEYAKTNYKLDKEVICMIEDDDNNDIIED